MTELTTQWDMEAIRSRIMDARSGRRYAGGSPDAKEIAAYAAGLPPGMESKTAVVLGMTPELRRLTATRFARTYAVDSNPQVINVYRDWLEPRDLARETIILGNWFHLTRHVPANVEVVLGDGVFGNLPNSQSHRSLLEAIGAVLCPQGRFITRMAMIPRGFTPSEHAADVLLRRFRAGLIDEAEFGFGTRLVGHYGCCYDAETCILDNAKLYAECEEILRRGDITDSEHAILRRYYFGGRNCIISQKMWEKFLSEVGFEFRIHPCQGKQWYAYYAVYEASLSRTPQRHGVLNPASQPIS